MESKSICDILNGGLMRQLLSLIEESGVSASQAREIPHFLEDAINSKNEQLLSKERFSTFTDCSESHGLPA